MSAEEQNALYRAQARYQESVVPTWEKVAVLTADEYEQRYLAAWEKFYQAHPYYLYPDDRLSQEYEARRLEEVSALSYERTAHAVQQARATTLERLTRQADEVLANTTGNAARSILAALLWEATGFISCCTLQAATHPTENETERKKRILDERPVFETIQASRFAPRLPGWSGKPDYIVDEPERVGGILGQLEHFSNLRAQFLAAELPQPAPTSQKLGVGIFRPGFNDEVADWIASEVRLIDSAGNYIGKPGFSASRLCGFYWQLREAEIVAGNLEELRDYFAMRYLKCPISTKPSMTTAIANAMAVDTKKVIKRLNQGEN